MIGPGMVQPKIWKNVEKLLHFNKILDMNPHLMDQVPKKQVTKLFDALTSYISLQTKTFISTTTLSLNPDKTSVFAVR